GWMQNCVRATTRAPRPSVNSSSVMLGTRQAIRASGPAKGCAVPTASEKVVSVVSLIGARCLKAPPSGSGRAAPLDVAEILAESKTLQMLHDDVLHAREHALVADLDAQDQAFGLGGETRGAIVGERHRT